MIIVNNRDRIEWQANFTVSDLFEKLGYEYSLITVTVNDRLIPEDEYAITIIPDNASVIVFHLAHGG